MTFYFLMTLRKATFIVKNFAFLVGIIYSETVGLIWVNSAVDPKRNGSYGAKLLEKISNLLNSIDMRLDKFFFDWKIGKVLLRVNCI